MYRRPDRQTLAGSLVAVCWLLLPAASPIPWPLVTVPSAQVTGTTDFWSTFRSWLPGAAALGVLVSILTYLFNNRKERQFRFEDKVAENIGTLVTFPGDSTVTLGKAYNALCNLYALGQVAGRRVRLGLEDRVADALARIVSFDLDLNNSREARFDALALDHWPRYSRLLAANPEIRDGVFYRYMDAFHSLQSINPDRFKTSGLARMEGTVSRRRSQTESFSILLHLWQAIGVTLK